MWRPIIEFVMFATSTGVFFSDQLRRNFLAVAVAGLIAVASTVSLAMQVIDYVRAPGATTSVLIPTADDIFWLSIKESSVIALFEEFLRKYPESNHAKAALVRLEQLRGKQVNASPPLPPPTPQRLCVTFNGRQVCE